MYKSIVFLFFITLISCNESNKGEVWEDEVCCCPPTIYLQPCNSFTEREANNLMPQLRPMMEELILPDVEIVILPHIQLSDSLKNAAKTRFRADYIIKSMQDNQHDELILLIHDDISLPYRNRSDWGVIGLSILPKHVCVVSDFRLKNKKRDYWKAVIHEFVHSFFEVHHCPKDNPSCIMQDAKGKANFSNKTIICEECRKQIHPI